MPVSKLRVRWKDSSNTTVPAQVQARQILEHVLAIHTEDESKAMPIGITYSANATQTGNIRARYTAAAQGGSQDAYVLTSRDVSGSNQAEVIPKIMDLLRNDPKYSSLKSIFRVIPITTMDYKGLMKVGVQDEAVQESLDAATSFCQNQGGHLIGWVNQDSDNVAIGGAVSASVQTPSQINMIAAWSQNHFASVAEIEEVAATQADESDLSSNSSFYLNCFSTLALVCGVALLIAASMMTLGTAPIVTGIALTTASAIGFFVSYQCLDASTDGSLPTPPTPDI